MNPIFIIGAPRSGTTLLRIMLNRHSSIALCDETYYFYYVYMRRRAFGDLKKLKTRRLLVDRYLATNRIKNLGVDLNVLAETLMKEGDSYKNFFESLMRFYAYENGKTRYGEKTPQHVFFSKILCEWYPSCRIIHLIRDPRDVVASLERMPWASNSVLANARFWLKCTIKAIQNSHRDNYMLVRYEELVSQPKEELDRILTFIGEEYRPSMLITDEQPEEVKWWFQRAHSPLTVNRVGRWFEQLDQEQIAIVEWLAGKYMRQFGYEQTGRDVDRGKIIAFFIDEYLDKVRQRFINWPGIWYHWINPTNLAAEEFWIDRN